MTHGVAQGWIHARWGRRVRPYDGVAATIEEMDSMGLKKALKGG